PHRRRRGRLGGGTRPVRARRPRRPPLDRRRGHARDGRGQDPPGGCGAGRRGGCLLMARTPLLAGNWKMYKTEEQAEEYIQAGLVPILCVGESEEERDRDETDRKLRQQVKDDLANVPAARLAEVVIAYEPIWAIGTGRVATPEQAQEAIAFIRALVGDRDEAAAAAVRVIYGGSVNADNAAEILVQTDVDGALVGGASLDPDEFAEIVAAAP